MRAVVDTSVLVSALIRQQGAVGPVLKHLRDGAFTLIYSAPLYEFHQHQFHKGGNYAMGVTRPSR